MKADKHLESAEEFEKDAIKLNENPPLHYRGIISCIFHAIHHYIAHGLEKRGIAHTDKHAGVSRLLREKNYEEVANLFTKMDSLRHGRVYGSKGNGETVKLAFEILDEVKKWAIKN